MGMFFLGNHLNALIHKNNQSTLSRQPGNFYNHCLDNVVYCHHHGVMNDINNQKEISYAVNFLDVIDKQFKVHVESINMYQYLNKYFHKLHEQYNTPHSFISSITLDSLLRPHSILIKILSVLAWISIFLFIITDFFEYSKSAR